MASRPGEGSLAQRIGTKAVDIAQGMAGGCILGGAYRGSTAGDAGRAIGASAGNKLTAGY